MLQYVLSDHLGSTSTIVDASGDYVARTGYMPWGGERFSTADIPTDYRYTGQRLEDDLGIYYYNARWYDPSIGRFLQADTIVPDPGNPLAYDRYSYVLNNPLRYTDPSGKFAEEDIPLLCPGCTTWSDVDDYFGSKIAMMLNQKDITFESIILAGDVDGVTNEYAFILQGYYDGHQDHFEMAVWNLTNNSLSDLDEVFSHGRFTIWSRNTDFNNSGYYFTGYAKGIDSIAGETWATPSINSFNDLGNSIKPNAQYSSYREYKDYGFWDMTAFTVSVFSLALDLPSVFGLGDSARNIYTGVKFGDHPLIDNTYPLVYTGNEWVPSGPLQYFSFNSPSP